MLPNASLIAPRRTQLAWILGGSLLALVIGGVAAINAQAGVALCTISLLLVLLLKRFEAILFVLVAAVFLEVVSFGGITISRLVAPVGALAVLMGIAAGRRLSFGIPLVWATLYSLWAGASLLWTTDSAATLHLLASLLIALVFTFAFAVLIDSRHELEHVLMAISVAAVCVGIFAIASFAHLGGASTLQQGRAGGTSGDANFFASYELVALPVMFALSTQVRRAALRNLLYIGCLVVVGAVLTTLSRGGLVTLGTILVIALVLPSKRLFRSRRQKVVVLMAILAAAGLIFQVLSAQFLPRLQELFNGTDSGGSGRAILWRAAETSINERPFQGLGFGTFPSQANQLIFRTPNISLAHYEPRPGGEEVHNAYLGTAAELGLVGLVLFLGLLLSTALALRRSASRARAVGNQFVAHTSSALLISLAGWATASIFLSSETSRPLWILIGLSLSIPKLLAQRAVESRSEEDRASP